MRICRLLLSALIAMLPTMAPAAVYCVSDSAGLSSAVQAAQASSTVDDEIRLRTGDYVSPLSTSALQLAITGDQALVISGGWSGAGSACTQQSIDPGLTRFVSLANNFQMLGIRYSGGTTGSLALDNVEIQGFVASA